MRITSLTLPSIHHDTSLNFKKLEGNVIIRAVDVPAGGASGFRHSSLREILGWQPGYAAQHQIREGF